MSRTLTLATLLALALPVIAPAQTKDSATAEKAVPSVKVSLSRDDPNVHSMMDPSAGFYEFHLFVDDHIVRGFEMGATIDGGTLLGYVVDTDRPWSTLPLGGYPGTLIQAAAGDNCYEPPVFVGKFLVKPDTPGGPVIVDITTSSVNELSAILNCDMTAEFAFHAYPAAMNAEAPKDHMVRGGEVETTPYPGAAPPKNTPPSVTVKSRKIIKTDGTEESKDD